MHAEIKQIGPADYELVLTESAETLRPKLDAALKAYRNRVQMRGFRPGKAPLQMVQKLYGREVAAEIAEKEVQYAFEEEVLDNPAYSVIGRPALTELEYDGQSDLKATVRFGVRPQVELQDLSSVTLSRLTHDVTDAEVDEEVELLRERAAETEPAPEEEIGETHGVTLDLQQLDETSGTPLIGKKEEGVKARMDDPNLKDELREALLGKKQGDQFSVSLPHGEGDHVHTHPYQVTIKEVLRRMPLEVGDELAQKVSGGQFETLDALRAEIRSDLEKSWKQRRRDYAETQIVEKLSELHPVPVPESALELYLDSYVQRLRDRYAEEGQDVPPTFDEAGFRHAMRGEAERQARWMLIRDHLIEQENIEVTDEDYDAFFAEAGGTGLDPQLLRRYYEGMKGLMDQLEQRIQSEKLFDRLEERFQYVDKSMEEIEEELRAKREAEESASASAEAEAEEAASEASAEEEPAS